MSFLWPCVLTVAVETAFFLLLGYRDRAFAALCICANVATNLSLNLLLGILAGAGLRLGFVVYPLEILVVVAEFAVYSALRGRSWKLLALTLAANALSYGAGLLIYGHV